MTVDLAAFTLDDQDSWFCEPFTLVDRQGKTWNVASNRVWWIAFRGKAKAPRWKGEGEELTLMLRFLHTPPEEPEKVKVETLKEWIDGVAPKKKGVILGAVFTLSFVKRVIETAPKETIKIWSAKKAVGDGRSIGMEAPGWKAVVMGLELGPAGYEVFKGYEVPASKGKPVEDDSGAKRGFAAAMSLGSSDDD